MGWKRRLVQALRWGLLFIVLFVGYLGAGLLSTRDEFTWWIVPALMLLTTTAVVVAKKVGPSPRASIVLAGVDIILVALIALAEMETPGRYVLCATVGCLLGLAIGTIISTTKGPERSKVVRALRWALFLLVAGFASWLWTATAELLLAPVRPDWLNWAVVTLISGVDVAILISAAALVAPSHRAMVILLMGTLSYAIIFWGYEFNEFPYSLLGVPDSSPRDAYLYLGLLTWGIGLAAGGFAALRIPAYLDASRRRIADATANQGRRYQGTVPFQDLDLDRKTFFGRGHESRSLLSQVLAERLVVLFAKSGMGKSSLINASLAEPLRQKQYFPIVIRLNVLPQGLVQSVLDGVRQAARNARVDIVGGEGSSVWQFFKTAEFWSEHDDLLRPVLILDQFEEIFTLHNKEVRKEFIEQLSELVRGRSETPRSAEKPALPEVKVIIALREDFLANLEELASEIPAILHNRFRLGPLGLEAAREAIIEPARVANEAFQTATFTYQEAAVERMLAFLAKRRLGVETTTSDEVEPVQLQIVCHYLEEVVRRRQATEGNDIEIQISESDLGGEEHMQQVLEGFYDRIIASVKPRRKAGAVRRLCETRLISRSGRRLTEDPEEITRRFKISEELLRHLVDARLLRAEARLNSTFYEVSHDRLVEPILQSRRKRRVKQRWVNVAVVVLVITVVGSHAYEIVEHQQLVQSKQVARERIQLESMLFSPEPVQAIEAMDGLVTQHRDHVPDIVKKIKEKEIRHLNPSVLVIRSMDSVCFGREPANLTGHDGTMISRNCKTSKTIEPHLTEILEHIEKHYDSDLNPSSSSSGGIPTLLGSLIFTLDTASQSNDPETSERAKRLRKDVLLKYEQRRQTKSSLDSECRRPNDTTGVTNRQYRCFYPEHSDEDDEDNEPVQVNWYEALAYSAYRHKTLPEEKSVEGPSSTWCVKMAIPEDEKQFSLSSLSGSFRPTSPCSVKSRAALLTEKRKFKVFPVPETAVR